jgi:RHS repeat-associated protein
MKRLFYLATLLLPILVVGQSTTQNYVKTKTYKIPTTTTIATPSETQATQNVTYFDGLGRPIQQLAHKQSATGKDIAIPLVYDDFGRQIKDYLPIPLSTDDMSFTDNEAVIDDPTSYYTTMYGVDGSHRFSEKRLENSPLHRILEQAAPGNDWSMNNADKHTIRFDYQTNSANEVKLYKATATWSATLGLYEIALVNGNGSTFYTANQLYKTVIKNENWEQGDGNKNTTEEFKDKEGRVVMKRTYGSYMVNFYDEVWDWHETYYVYDQFGNLTYVIPPVADGAITTTELNGMCYQYKYDYRNRLVEKKLPGKQWEYIVYDKLDRVIMTGPSTNPLSVGTVKGWMINKYDAFNRIVLTGWLQGTPSNTTRKNFQNNHTAATIVSEIKTTTGVTSTINGVAFRYTNSTLPTSGYHILTINYYDDYDTNLTFTPAIAFTNIHDQELFNNTIENRPKGLPTVSWDRVLEISTLYNNERSYTLYDKKGRAIRVFKNNRSGGYTQTDQKLQVITGRVDFTETRHKRRVADEELYVKEVFTYTEQDRLLSHTHQIGTSGIPQLLVKNDYDELGQLITKQVGGSDTSTYIGLQKVDYSYNIRGWLKAINDIDNLSQSGYPTDLFAFKLNYNTIEDEDNYAGKRLYNGNISESYWKTFNGDVKRKYTYFYDNLSRLIAAGYQRPGDVQPFRDSYSEYLGYDKNGNIKRLYRTGDVDDVYPTLLIDDLYYTYDSNNPNRLKKVYDDSAVSSGFKDGVDLEEEYTYDDYGNMTMDKNKGITNIYYNHLNLPRRITFGANEQIEYIYTGTGRKVKKSVNYTGQLLSTVEYEDGYQYIKNTTGSVYLGFFPHAEGYVRKEGNKYIYVFNYTDHLGNVRLSYADFDKDGVVEENEHIFECANDGSGNCTSYFISCIVEENNYYPFGLKHSGYNDGNFGSSNYNYKYNGKELQDELSLNWYDYGARNYDPAIGRWMNIDPLSEKFHDFSPYNYVLNNPLSFIDPDGQYPKPVLIYNQATNTYRFTNAASHLLSLVSGVDKRKIQNSVIQPRAVGQYRPWFSSNNGGGAITLGTTKYHTITYTENWFEDDASKYKGHGYGQDIYRWLSLSSHEVGHIEQIDRKGGFFSYVGEFIKQYSSAGNHDGAEYEKEADIGQKVFGQFNSFLNEKYGRNSLTDLFENHTDPVIVKRLDKWWKEFEKYRGQKEERTKSFIEGLSTNLGNFSEGTYIYNGSNWVKKN